MGHHERPFHMLLAVVAITTLLVSMIITSHNVRAFESFGLGDKIMLQSGSLLNDELRERNANETNLIFQRRRSAAPSISLVAKPRSGEASSRVGEVSSGETVADKLYESYVDLIKSWRIDVVAPGRDLTKLMNVVSTKSRANFLKEHNEYFSTGHWQLGSTNRPMLLAHLGLKLTSRDQLKAWYEDALKGPAKGRAAQSCKSLLAVRNKQHAPSAATAAAAAAEPGSEVAREEDSLWPELRQLKLKLSELQEQRNLHFHLAYLTFSNNLNLFMLENFLILCDRLELLKQASSRYEQLF